MNYLNIVLLFIYIFSQSINARNGISGSTRANISIGAINGLEFPSNGDSPQDAFVAFQFSNPQNDGLPIWGPNKQGVTWIWEIKPYQQTGYYVTFWWSNNGTLNWDNGNTNTYIGAHPYPRGYVDGTVHDWELAGGSGEMWPTDGGASGGGDYVETKAGGGQTKLVIKNQWYTQALRVKVNNDGSKTNSFFITLPETTDSNVIENTAPAIWGEKKPPYPAITFGDSPWGPWIGGNPWTERLSGVLGRIKIIDTVMTGSDILAEAADMSRLVTPVARRNIWWGIQSFDSVDDLTCDYGTGRSFHWVDVNNKAKLFEIQKGTGYGTVKFDTTAVGDSIVYTMPIYADENNMTVYGVTLSVGEHYSVSADGFPKNLNQGDSMLVTLKFMPGSEGLLMDTLLVENSSAINPIKVYLSGYGAKKSENPEFDTVRFDTIAVGESSTYILPIYAHESSMTVYGVTLSVGAHYSVSADGFPKELNQGDFMLVTLKFMPGSEGLLMDTLLVENSSAINPIKVYISGYGAKKTGIHDEADKLPRVLTLHQNFPNPFNPKTTINYELPDPANVEISIFNVSGQLVKILFSGKHQAGYYSVSWDGTNDREMKVPSGLYLCRITADKFSKSIKMILLD